MRRGRAAVAAFFVSALGDKMKRDLKILTTVLEKIEDDSLERFIDHPLGEDVDERKLGKLIAKRRQILLGHLLLLKESGYTGHLTVKVNEGEDSLELCCSIPRLTMKGHDLLAMLRSASLYERMKEILDGTGLPLTADTLELIQHEAADELIREWVTKTKAKN